MSIVRRRRKDFNPINASDDIRVQQLEKKVQKLESLVEILDKRLDDHKKKSSKSKKGCPVSDIDVSKLKDGMGLIWSSKSKKFVPQILLEEEE